MVVASGDAPGTRVRAASPAGVPGRPSRPCARRRCGPRSSARRCRRRSGSRRTPPRCPPTSPSTATTSAPAGSSCCTTRPATTPGTAPSAAWPTPAPRSTLELITDPLLADVGWTWLTEALDAHGAAYAAPSGTVTRVATESFGGMADEPRHRADRDPRLLDPAPPRDARPVTRSTSPRTWRPGASCCARPPGCEPVPEGVAVMPSRRGQRGPGADVGRRHRRPPSGDEPEAPPRARGRPLLTLRRRPPADRRHRGRRWPRCAPRSPPAPDRSRSTPSAPPATATPTAPT